MPKQFPTLSEGQRIEVYLKDGKIREGKFMKWMNIEGTNYLFVDMYEQIKDGMLNYGSWFMSEESINRIYPL